MKKKRLSNLKERAIKVFFFINGVFATLALVGIFFLLLFTAIPAFKEINIGEFFTSTRWNPTSPVKEGYGILSMVVSTFMVTIGALVIAIPIGIGAAAYLSDVAHWRVREIVKPIVEILAGIPSVVIGFLGIVLFGPIIAKIFGTSNGLNAVNGSLRTMTATIAIELGEVPYYTTHYYALFAVGFVLFIITFFVKMKKKIIETLGFFGLRVCLYIVFAFLLIFLYDIGSKGAGTLSWEFLSQAPRRGMTEGGIFPAIVGTFFCHHCHCNPGCSHGHVCSHLSERIRQTDKDRCRRIA